MLTQTRLQEIAAQLSDVAGIAGVVLGGSRARGTERPDSDIDLGLYYRPPLDVTALRRLARALARHRSDRDPITVTEPGEWGSWVDGGAWLKIDDMAVDWLYRDLDRVRRSVEHARTGRFTFHFQVGHPLGVPDFAYAGELAVGVVLADPAGELAQLRQHVATFPPALADAIIDRLAEADFLLGALVKPARRGDTAYVAGTLFRVLGLCAHAVHARAGRWVINEKGLIDAAGALPAAPADFSRRAHAVLGRLGTRPDELSAAVAAVAQLVAEIREG